MLPIGETVAGTLPTEFQSAFYRLDVRSDQRIFHDALVPRPDFTVGVIAADNRGYLRSLLSGVDDLNVFYLGGLYLNAGETY